MTCRGPRGTDITNACSGAAVPGTTVHYQPTATEGTTAPYAPAVVRSALAAQAHFGSHGSRVGHASVSSAVLVSGAAGSMVLVAVAAAVVMTRWQTAARSRSIKTLYPSDSEGFALSDSHTAATNP